MTKFTFDATGRMSSLTDPVGNTTTLTRNIIGQVSRETVVIDKISRVRYFDYDASGNIIAKYDRNKRVTEWTFDKLNRHTSEIWYDSEQSWRAKKPYKKFTTTYNKKGKIETINDNDNKFTFSYGIFGNEIKQVQTIAGFNKPIEQNFVTDINGLKTEKSFSVDGKIDHTNQYEFDSLNRATNISQTIENNTIKSLQINYDDFGQLAKQSKFDVDKPIIETENKYDEAGRLINISHAGNQKTYADYDITWDNGNRITDFDFTYLNGPAKKNQSNYSYDKTSQLTSATYNFMQDERYNFDKNGNRIKAEIQNKEQTYKTAEYNRLISDNESEYKYDLEGNRIAKISKDGSTIKYHWDNRNRLIKIETPNGSIEYIYDHQNRIVLRKQGETTTTFIHDGWQIVLQFDNDKQTHRYLWGTKQDELICDNDNWTLNDHLNTIRDIVKSDGTVTDHLEYNSFGKIISATKNDSSLQFAYTGKLTDKESDLQGNINRWYDAEVGRWMSEDPIGFRGGDGNLYRYGENSVVVLLDISGNAAVGTFDVKIVICNVEPEQVKGAGGEHVPCYDITYNKPNNICITKNSKLSLAQALSSGSWYNIAGLPAHFDNYNDENNKGKKYPDYLGQSGGAGNMRDAPTSEQATIWNITVCAKCTECKDGKTNEAILGCISFSWDSDKKVWSGPGKTPTKKIELKQDGTATSEKGIPASDPDRLWRNAVKHWEKWVRESNK